MKAFHLEDVWTCPEKERVLVAAITAQPELYGEFSDLLAGDVFTDPETAKAWKQLAEVIEAGELPEGIPAWEPADDPQAIVNELVDLRQRRILDRFI